MYDEGVDSEFGFGAQNGGYHPDPPEMYDEISGSETILSRQLKLLSEAGIREVVMTTGYLDDVLMEYIDSLALPVDCKFIKNERYRETNYIYSIYCAKEELDDDILLMHGDLVFDSAVLKAIMEQENSCMKVSSTLPLPEKDFKAVVEDGLVKKVGIEFFDSAMEAQALYKLNQKDWRVWLDEIIAFCESGNTNVYAENAFNAVSDRCKIVAFDVQDRLCTEVDTPEDLAKVKAILKNG